MQAHGNKNNPQKKQKNKRRRKTSYLEFPATSSWPPMVGQPIQEFLHLEVVVPTATYPHGRNVQVVGCRSNLQTQARTQARKFVCTPHMRIHIILIGECSQEAEILIWENLVRRARSPGGTRRKRPLDGDTWQGGPTGGAYQIRYPPGHRKHIPLKGYEEPPRGFAAQECSSCSQLRTPSTGPPCRKQSASRFH